MAQFDLQIYTFHIINVVSHLLLSRVSVTVSGITDTNYKTKHHIDGCISVAT